MSGTWCKIFWFFYLLISLVAVIFFGLDTNIDAEYLEVPDAGGSTAGENVLLTENGEPFLDENGEPFRDENNDPLDVYMLDENDAPFLNENGDPLKKDAYMLDENGDPILDENGDPLLKKDAYMLDENGKPFLDENGDPLLEKDYKTDENGVPVKKISTTLVQRAGITAGAFLTTAFGIFGVSQYVQNEKIKNKYSEQIESNEPAKKWMETTRIWSFFFIGVAVLLLAATIGSGYDAGTANFLLGFYVVAITLVTGYGIYSAFQGFKRSKVNNEIKILQGLHQEAEDAQERPLQEAFQKKLDIKKKDRNKLNTWVDEVVEHPLERTSNQVLEKLKLEIKQATPKRE